MSDKQRSKEEWIDRLQLAEELIKKLADCGCHTSDQTPRIPNTRDGLEKWLKSAPASLCRVKNIESQHPDERTDLPRLDALVNYWMCRHQNAPASKKKLKFKGSGSIPDVSAKLAESAGQQRIRKTAHRNALVNPK